jgi:hypothetical protein
MTTEDEGWPLVLSRTAHDFYHLPGYAELCAKRVGGDALGAHISAAEGELFVPLVRQAIPSQLLDGWFDVSSPYGYPGPLLRFEEKVTSAARDRFVGRALESLCDELRERRILTAFLRLHPLLTEPIEPFARVGQLVLHGRTVAIDLTMTETEIWHQVRPNHRTGIHRGIRLGHRVERDVGWTHLEQFASIYRATMDRVHAAPNYYFDVRHFEELRAALGPERLHLFMVLDDEQALAGALFTEVSGIVQFHLGGTRSDSLRLHPHKLLYLSVARWAKGRGNRVLHLGGGVAGFEDSLYHFKAGFSHVRRPFYTWRRVLDSQLWSSIASDPASVAEASSFFPTYRQRRATL